MVTIPKIAPSILSANPLNLLEEIRSVEALGIDWHHIDVMDGHFVPNLTFGPPLVKAIKAATSTHLDVHIMISNPDEMAQAYISAGADSLSFHVEAACHHHRLIQLIKSEGAMAGVAINPGTSLRDLDPLLDELDYITVMSVNPGFGGQKFIRGALKRIKALRQSLVEIGRGDVDIVVDGGVNKENSAQLISAGATVLVAGSFIYGSKDRRQAVSDLKNCLS